MKFYIEECHNPYFNRWFSAIISDFGGYLASIGHNPYFNRWFSAMSTERNMLSVKKKVTILILIDGFLQLEIF